MLRRGLTIAATTLALSTAMTHTAAADGGKGNAESCETVFICVDVGIPGRPGSGGGGSGPAPDKGSGTGEKAADKEPPGCVYQRMEPQPPADSWMWAGHKPGDGAIYEAVCQGERDEEEFAMTIWSADPPEATVNPAVLAREAVDKMLLRGPEIGITPKPGGKGVVGMPVYMWTARGAETYGPNTASASAGGITVTATAKVAKIEWQMGDGTTVTCTTPGTPYKAEYGKKPSPDCGHRYTKPSSTTASGDYHVTATSTWDIDWQVNGGGASGEMTEIRDSAVDITVAEVQVLN
ncbi:ATP/GTP-binding protein [Streptomyces albidoflavus]|uniref:ATP/GTP-binding protein n=1 Tax=Streptomyces albidoflavus TaxID=1886 RepID=UPI00331C4451